MTDVYNSLLERSVHEDLQDIRMDIVRAAARRIPVQEDDLPVIEITHREWMLMRVAMRALLKRTNPRLKVEVAALLEKITKEK